jgi:hypothetical protein
VALHRVRDPADQPPQRRERLGRRLELREAQVRALVGRIQLDRPPVRRHRLRPRRSARGAGAPLAGADPGQEIARREPHLRVLRPARAGRSQRLARRLRALGPLLRARELDRDHRLIRRGRRGVGERVGRVAPLVAVPGQLAVEVARVRHVRQRRQRRRGSPRSTRGERGRKPDRDQPACSHGR